MYSAPVDDIAFTHKHVAGLEDALSTGALGDLGEDLVDAILHVVRQPKGVFSPDLDRQTRPRPVKAQRIRHGQKIAQLPQFHIYTFQVSNPTLIVLD